MGQPARSLRPVLPAPVAGALMLSLPEQIAAQLAARITAGTYQPGQRIMEQALAAEFSVSRGPVRDALRLLEKDGLVTIIPRRGAQVTKLSIQEVREIFDIRVALNGLRDRGIAEDPERSKLLPMLEAVVAELSRLAHRRRKGEPRGAGEAGHQEHLLRIPEHGPRVADLAKEPPPVRASALPG